MRSQGWEETVANLKQVLGRLGCKEKLDKMRKDDLIAKLIELKRETFNKPPSKSKSSAGRSAHSQPKRD